ncbi:uncharacterized protein FA14DRAFT_118260 [Meira miltonrushii]|uniref:Uncharacterized protein n=1 Tax=Meira miltonrushii TaxID=1280837 RepID=A0A316VS52_9BASI|nr:uncharacterized protein FA14DRAFT_118260 [Meira miltonrushii]PWN38335.1 hypothetical protein FA14DRAFT_118260 [Meira miltonrushii]
MVTVQSAPVPESEASPLEARMTSSRITWYSGGSLDNPACGGPTPSNNAMIAAVQQGGRFGCGDHIRINYQGNSVKVKVIDYCEGCSSTAIDLTKGAFSKLASLSTGELHGASVNWA